MIKLLTINGKQNQKIGKAMMKKLFFLSILLITYQLFCNDEQQKKPNQNPWDKLLQPIEDGLKTTNLPIQALEKILECKKTLNKILKEYPQINSNLTTMLNEFITIQNEFNSKHSQYWSLLDKIAVYQFTPEIEKQFTKNEIFFEQAKQKKYQDLEKLKDKYWLSHDINKTKTLFSSSELYSEVLKEFLTWKQTFDKKGLAYDCYWNVEDIANLIINILNILSQPPIDKIKKKFNI